MTLYEKISPLLLQTLIWIPTRLFFLLFGKLKVEGVKNVKYLKRGVIFAVNHSSQLDPILLPASLPFFCRLMPMYYTARERDFYKTTGLKSFLYWERTFRAWGAHKVRVGIRNYKKSLSKHIDILRDGGSVMIFPEGGVTKDGNLREAKGGVAYLSYKTKKPVVPVGISGVFKIKFSDMFFRKREIKLKVGKPIFPEDIFPKGYIPVAEYKIIANDIILKEISKLVRK